MRAASLTGSSVTSRHSRASAVGGILGCLARRASHGLAHVVVLAAICATVMPVPVAHAQVAANERWRTLATPHFEVHFTPALEREARHAAAIAEVAYANLATELVPPRGMVDIVISDATDVSNGLATVSPRNRIIIYARPPVDEVSLESYDDWTALVLQHELTHIFHLDRTRGWWRIGQYVFGRNPVLFPNYYTPAWLTEGLAVYYESRFTSGGRLEGSYQAAVARAAAVDHLVPTLGQLSLATSRFPFGQSVYVYGSFVWDDLARRHGAATVPAFVERYSAATIPFLLDHQAKKTFGETFTHAWRTWRDSALRTAGDSLHAALADGANAAPLAVRAATVIPGGGRYIIEPRWRDDSTLVYAGNNGRESQGVYEVVLGSEPRRLARRNSLDVNAPEPNGGLVFSQGEFLDRFHVRGDLYIHGAAGEHRLTAGARLSEPAVRSDGRLLAVQTTPGATRLVTITSDGRDIVPLTEPAMDTQWTAPRWSPSGARIVAVRIARGMGEIVTLDSAGSDVRVLQRGRAVLRSPTWTPDGDAVVFTSDQSGVSQLYVLAVSPQGDAIGAPVPLTHEPGGAYGVDVVRLGPDSARVATTALRGDGYHLVVWTVDASTLRPAPAGSPRILADERADARWRVPDDSAPARRYSPWRTLVPAYWSPTFAQEASGRGALVGALTSATDVSTRHSYVAQADVNTRNGNVDASLQYVYNRLLEPSFNVALEQAWSYSSIVASGRRVGDLERRIRFASLHATFVRPRARTYSALTVGGEIEERAYSSNPGSLLARLDPFYSATHRYPTLVAAAVFANTQRPTLSISPEDGISATAVVRQRWEASAGTATRSAVAITSAYKSLDLPGFAHHVLALRLAGGVADRRAPSEYDVGGVSGAAFEIVPGVAFGGAARTFPVRGFAAASESGIYATSASAEYRLPLSAPSRGLGLFPLFVDRASLALFTDAGRASCPAGSTPACSPSSSDGPTLASVGGELDIDSALQFDVPYRFRLGMAHPVHGREYAGASALTAYLTVGASF